MTSERTHITQASHSLQTFSHSLHYLFLISEPHSNTHLSRYHSNIRLSYETVTQSHWNKQRDVLNWHHSSIPLSWNTATLTKTVKSMSSKGFITQAFLSLTSQKLVTEIVHNQLDELHQDRGTGKKQS